MSTHFPSGKGLAVNRKWCVLNAADKTLAAPADEVKRMLSGKNNPAYTPFLDMGDHVVIRCENDYRVNLCRLKIRI